MKLITETTNDTKGIYFVRSSEEKEFVSYKSFYNLALNQLNLLQEKGINERNELIFQFSDNKSFLVTFWACLLGKIKAVPIHAASTPETRRKLINVWKTLDAPFIIADDPTFQTLVQKLDYSELKHFNTNKLIRYREPDCTKNSSPYLPEIQADDIAFIQFSSGSTGNPKGVCLTHKNLLTNVRAIINNSGLNKEDSTLGWMPLTHDLGLIGFHLVPLICEIDQFLIPTEVFVRRPSIWLEKINENRISFTASPNFGYKHFLSFFKEESAQSWDLSCVKRILNGAEPISAELCDEFLNRMEKYGLKKETMFPVYGMAEASLAVAFPEPNFKFQRISLDRNALNTGGKIITDENGVTFVSVGKAVDDCSIRISNNEFLPLGEDHIGHIEIKGDNVTQGYYNNPDANKQSFTSGGWFRTGDLGFFHEDNLYITGRVKDIIFSNGLNLYPHDLERIIETECTIASGKVIVCGISDEKKHRDEIFAFVAYKGKIEDFVDIAEQIKTVVRKRLSLDLDNVIPVNSIEKTTSGKVRRFMYVENYLKGVYDDILVEKKQLNNARKLNKKTVLPENETEKVLYDLWTGILQENSISTDDNFFEIGGNSLKANMLIGQIARELKVEITIREVFKSPTIKRMASLLEDKSEQQFTSIPSVSKRQHYPCSSAQKRLFILNQLEPDSLNYNISTIYKISGQIDETVIFKAFQVLVQKHSILRTYFDLINGVPVQRVAEEVNFIIEKIPFTESVEQSVTLFFRPFNLFEPNLFRIGLCKDDSGNSYLLFDIHHIISDGYSLNLIIKEFSQLYANPVQNTDAEGIEYVDFSVWQEDYLQSDKIKSMENFWLEEFSDEIPVLNFPTDIPREKKTNDSGDFISFELDSKLYDALERVANSENSTFYIVFLAALNVLLSRYTNQEDIIIGTPVTNRPHADLQSIFGPFINSLPLRNKPKGELTFREFHKQVKENVLNAFTNQDYPFEQLVDKLHLSRDLSHNALFDILFVLQNANNEVITLEDLVVDPVEYFNGNVKFDLNIHAWEADRTFRFKIEYNSSLYKRERIISFADHFRRLLNHFAQNIDTQIDSVQLNNQQETELILQHFNATKKEFPFNHALELFDFHCKHSPEKVGVVSQKTHLTFKELDGCANWCSETLLQNGVVKGDKVGVSVQGSEKVIIAMLAIWKAGATFIPIDPENPEERKRYILSDSGIKVMFSEEQFNGVISLEINSENRSENSNVRSNQPTDGAYIIYTSGTTGNPKGTLISHRALANYTQSIASKHELTANDSSLLMTSYSFDLGYTSLFGALLNGGCIHFMNEENRKEAAYLVDYIVDNAISFIKSTPSQLFTLTSAINFHRLGETQSLQKIFTGGEAIKTDDLLKFRELNSEIKFINHYGPTESTIGCITHEISDLDSFKEQPVIGSPIHNTSIYILDKKKQIVPIGVDGEIHISGKGLASTYINQPELYYTKFIENPFGEDLLYATGDIGRWTAEGTIQFLGRIDDQVKIRGYRVETKEIENVLKSFEKIRDAIVTVVKDSDGTNNLCAYLVAVDRDANFRKELSFIIPGYMIPSYFIFLDEIPITANGKLDKKRLPKPEIAEGDKQKIEAIGDVQSGLTKIWQEVLGLHRSVGINENFFELGGHSLKATIVTSKIHQSFNVEITLREFFENPEIQLLEKVLKNKKVNPYASIPVADHASYYPVSSAQKRMYILHQIEGEATSYNMPGAFWIQGDLNYERLQFTFEALIKKHESLRTSFHMEREELVQRVHHSFEFQIQHLPFENNTEELIKTFIKSFDLAKAPLLRVGLAKVAESKHLLLFDIHHIISDGSSMGIIIKDFIEIYDQGYSDKLRIQYKDFAVWQKDFFNSTYLKNQKNYWLEQFNGDVPFTELPTDFERPKKQTFEGASFTFKFNRELTSQLKSICKEQDITLFMLLIGVYTIFLSKQTGQEEFTVGTPVAGRPHADLQNMIGVFLNTLVLKNQPKADKKVSDFLKEVKKTSLDAFQHQDYPFHELVESLDLERIQNRNPLFDTMLVVQNMNIGELRTNELTFEQYDFDLGSTQVDLSWIVFENEETLDFTVNYNTSLFKKQTVEHFVERLKIVAESVCLNVNNKIFEISILPESERNRLLHEFNNTRFEYDNQQSIVDLLTEQVALTPTKIAVVDDNREISYEELHTKTNQLANFLSKEGVQPGSIVPLILERSVDTIISIIAVLKTGASYVFVDPAYPKERISFMLEDCASDLIISQNSCLDKINFSGKKIVIDEIELSFENPTLLESNINIDNTAYLIYTSGSTGKPKGVMISHKNLIAFIAWAKEEFKNTLVDVVYNATSYSFDLSIFEIFYSLTSGKTVRVVKDGLHIANYLDLDKNVLINTVPVVVKELLASGIDLSSVKAINMAGEAIPQLVKSQLNYKTIEVRNLYGPSEDTTYSTCYRFTEENFVQNIGKPLANAQVYILDKNGGLLPQGTPGELCLSGDHLAKGYYNRENLTKEKFVDSPIEAGKKLYKTGDLARWLENGELEYLGRIDNQVKIRGFRIELEEIEKNLFKHPEVKDAVVVDLFNENTGDKFLCAYYVSNGTEEVRNLHTYLTAFLPLYMIPSNFVLLDKLPVSPNGKTDKKALPYPNTELLEEDVVLPQNEIEDILLQTWKQVLGINSIGTNSNFFSLGGDSIKAIQLTAKLQQAGLKLEVHQLFDYPTISELAPHIIVKKNKASQEEYLGEYELSPIQHYFFEQNFSQPNHWNQSIMLKSRERLDFDKLNNAFVELIKHHDILRSTFNNGKAEILSATQIDFQLELFEVENITSIQEKANEIQTSLNISTAKLIKACIFKKAGEDHLLIAIHHLAVDGISWRILVEDLQIAYNGEKLPFKTNSFNEWTHQLKELATSEKLIGNELNYWVETDSKIETSFSNFGECTIATSERTSIIIDKETTKLLAGEANAAYSTEVNDLLLTGLSRAFKQWNGTENLSITLEGHGREELFEDLNSSRTIGWFTSMFPVNLSFKDNLRENVIGNKDHLHKIPNKGIGYGLLKYYAEKELNAQPQISFNYLGELDNNQSNDYFQFSELETGNTISEINHRSHLIDFNLMLKKGELVIEITYDRNLLSASEIDNLLQLYKINLEKLVNHCLGKEQVEVTSSDMSFEISSDDFENIF